MKATIIVLALLGAFGSMESDAVTVYFGDADRGPSDTLQIGGVTISSPVSGGGQPATAAGSGLGNSRQGPNDSVDYVAHYPVGQQYPDGNANGVAEGIRLTVDGSFTSITLQPHFPVVLETGAPVDSDLAWFGMEMYSFGLVGGALFYPTNTAPVTITITPNFPATQVNNLQVWMDFESGGHFEEASILSGYRSGHLSEEQTIQLGFTIESVDYTPTDATIPEPSTAALLGMGLLLLLCAHPKLRPIAIVLKR